MNDTSNLPPYGAAPPPPPGPTGPAAADPSQSSQPSQPGPPDGRPGLTRFFDAIRGTGLHRSQHRVVGGVCGGIAERTGIDPTVVRVVAVVLAIFGGIGGLLYGLAWLLLPEPDGRIHGEQVLHGKVDAGAIGAIIVTLLSFGGPSGGHWGLGWGWHSGLFGLLWGITGTAVVIAVVVLVVYLAVRGRGSGTPGPGSAGYSGYPGYPGGPGYSGGPGYPPAPQPAQSPAAPTDPSAADNPAPPAPPTGATGSAATSQPGPAMTATYPAYGGAATLTAPAPVPPYVGGAAPVAPTRTRRPSLGGFAALVGGLALVGAGLAVVITRNGDYSVSTAAIAWAVALGIIALALIIGGVLGRRSGIVTLFALIALIGTIGASIVPKADHTQLVGEGTWRPVTAAEASGGFALGIGHATLDLSDLAQTPLSAADPITVKATVGIGQLTVKVPEGISVLVRTSAGAGSLPKPQAVTVTTNSQNVHDGSQFAGNDDHGNLGGASIKRTVTVGAGAPQLIVDAKVGVGEIDIQQVTP